MDVAGTPEGVAGQGAPDALTVSMRVIGFVNHDLEAMRSDKEQIYCDSPE
jgi:hypothetical protein